MTHELVIAHYAESLDWVRGQEWASPQIYSKGQTVATPLPIVDLLPNVGREAHTYLHYLITRYDSLPDYVGFCQGNPFDHCRTFIPELRAAFRRPKPFSGFGWQLHCDPRGCPEHCGLPLGFYSDRLFARKFSEFDFQIGAQFVVSAERVKRHPKSFYEWLYVFTREDEVMPWVLERLWAVIFDGCTNLRRHAIPGDGP
jgi:hypothetical protein